MIPSVSLVRANSPDEVGNEHDWNREDLGTTLRDAFDSSEVGVECGDLLFLFDSRGSSVYSFCRSVSC